MNDERIGTIAAYLGMISILPLIYHTLTSKSTESLSYPWLILQIVSQGLWLYYGYHNKIRPVIIGAIIFLSAYVILFLTKYYYESRGLNLLSQKERENATLQTKLHLKNIELNKARSALRNLR